MLRLKEVRKLKGYTQQDIANVLGISRSALTNIENEKREIDNNALRKLADFFDVSVDYLLGRTGDKKNKPTTDESDELMKLLQEPINKEFFELLSKVSPKTREGALAQLRVLAGLEDKQ